MNDIYNKFVIVTDKEDRIYFGKVVIVVYEKGGIAEFTILNAKYNHLTNFKAFDVKYVEILDDKEALFIKGAL